MRQGDDPRTGPSSEGDKSPDPPDNSKPFAAPGKVAPNQPASVPVTKTPTTESEREPRQ
jgi:hypothetical protein